MLKHYLRQAALTLILTSLSFYNHASAIEVTPTKIKFGNNQQYTFITVKNLSNDEVFIQAELLDWQQNHSRNIYTPSKELIVSPLIFSIPAESEQIVRLGRKNIEQELSFERSFRLLLSELPDQFKVASGLKMLLRLNLPIFIEPKEKSKKDLQWSSQIKSNSNVKLSIYNPNNFHKMVSRIELKDKLDKKLYEKQNAFIYILAKQKYHFAIENNQKLVDYIKLNYQNKNNTAVASLKMELGTPNGISNATAVTSIFTKKDKKDTVKLASNIKSNSP